MILSATASPTMMEALKTALTDCISMSGEVVTAVLSGDLKALLPLLVIGVGFSVIMFGVKCIKSFAWGT